MTGQNPVSLASASRARISLPDLEIALRDAAPEAVLVPARILRRVIKQHGRVERVGLRVPHRKTYVIDREELLAIVDRIDLDLPGDAQLIKTVILLARPTPEQLVALTVENCLVKYWRLLFHARIHEVLEQLVSDNRLNVAIVRRRIEEIGQVEFDEIRYVLRQEDLLLPGHGELATYIEFVAVLCELSYFARDFLKLYFPDTLDFSRLEAIVRQDLDVDVLFQASRLPGSPELPPQPDANEPATPFDAADTGPASGVRSDRAYQRLLDRADRVASLGNAVRAAILRYRAASFSSGETAAIARAAAGLDLHRLARRLQAALQLGEAQAARWTKALQGLLSYASRGIWSPEARLLYDLQKACVDYERGVYTLDLWKWIRSLGRQPLKRPLHAQQDVLMTKHLRTAATRVRSVRLSSRARSRLADLLRSATHQAELHVRNRLRPAIDEALDRVQLSPQNLPELVARDKLVDELLDRIVERGFLLIGDVRDALSRNSLKLPDLSNVRQLYSGDELLSADKVLAASLEGVYRRGEIYLRFPQRVSSLAFGTAAGRFFTRYLILPFGGAYVLQQFVVHMLAVFKLLHPAEGHAHETSPAWFYIGLVLLGLINFPQFRAQVLLALRGFGRVLRRGFVDWPRYVMSLPLVRALLETRPVRFFRRYALKPLLVTGLVGLLLSLTTDRDITLKGGVITFLLANVLLNSRFGRNVDEFVTDWFAQTWHRLRIHVFAAMFRMVMDFFNRILEAIERALYAVDEWLRFRSGERPATVALKAVAGSVWRVLNYAIRFTITLLVEPQINPIKHFPVVTVSHKILLPLIPALTAQLQPVFGLGWGALTATTVIFLTPGAIGFLVWELKENWRLYRANRPQALRPVHVGHHGETVLQLMKPGFRSGTLSRIYARARRAARKAAWTGQWQRVEKQTEKLRNVEEHVRRFVQRDFLQYLHRSRGWGKLQVDLGEVKLGTNRILVELRATDVSNQSLWLSFAEQSGWLVAQILERGWLGGLNETQWRTLDNALVGFYKMAAVDLVQQQLDAFIGQQNRYDISDHGLVVWPKHDPLDCVLYRLSDLQDQTMDRLPTGCSLQHDDIRSKVLFSMRPLAWSTWVTTWQLDQLAEASRQRVIEGVNVLPRSEVA